MSCATYLVQNKNRENVLHRNNLYETNILWYKRPTEKNILGDKTSSSQNVLQIICPIWDKTSSRQNALGDKIITFSDFHGSVNDGK